MGLADGIRGEILVTLHATSTSQAELARRLHLSNKHVNQVLRGKAALSCDLADLMLGAMGRRVVVHTEETRTPEGQAEASAASCNDMGCPVHGAENTWGGDPADRRTPVRQIFAAPT